MAEIGTVNVKLTGDASGLTGELAKIGPAAQAASLGSVRSLGALIAGLGVVAGAAYAVRKVVGEALAQFEKGESISKLSQSLGIATKDLNTMSAAAQLAESDVYTLGMSVGILSKHMVDGMADGSKFTDLVTKLGIQTRDAHGDLLETWEVLGNIGDLFKSLPDGATKTGLSMEFLGRGGKAWIPILNEGRAGLEQLRKTLDEIGAGPIPGFAKKSEHLMDTLKMVGIGADGVKRQISAALIPTFQAAADAALNWEKANNRLIATNVGKWAENFGEVIGVLLPRLMTAAGYIGTISDYIATGVARTYVNFGPDTVRPVHSATRRHTPEELAAMAEQGLAPFGVPWGPQSVPLVPLSAHGEVTDAAKAAALAKATAALQADTAEESAKKAKAVAEAHKAQLEAIVGLREAELASAQELGLADEKILAIFEQVQRAKLAALDADTTNVARATDRQTQQVKSAAELLKIELDLRAVEQQRAQNEGIWAANAATLAGERAAILESRGGATFAERLGSAQAQDMADRAGLVAQLGEKLAELQPYERKMQEGQLGADATEKALGIYASVNGLEKLIALLDESPRHVRGLTQEFLNIGDILDNQVSTAITGMLLGTGKWQDAGKNIGQAFMGEMVRSTIKEKHIFDGLIEANLLDYLPRLGKEGGISTGFNFISGMISKLTGNTGAGANALDYGMSIDSGAMSMMPAASAAGGAGTGAGLMGGGASAGLMGAGPWALVAMGAMAAMQGGIQIASGKASSQQEADVARSMVSGFSGMGPFVGLTNMGLGLNSTWSRGIDALMTMGISEALQGISGALGFKGFFGLGAPPTQEHVNMDSIRQWMDKSGLAKAQGTIGGRSAWGDHSIIDRPFAGITDKPEFAAFGQSILSVMDVGLKNDKGQAGDAVNAFVNNQILLGHSVERAKNDLLKLASTAGIDLDTALASLEQRWSAGTIGADLFGKSVAETAALFEKLPSIIDTGVLALQVLDTQGSVTFEHLQRVIEDAQSTMSTGMADTFKKLVTDPNIANASKGLAQTYADTFVDRFAQEMLKGPANVKMTQAVADATRAAELLAAGDKEGAATLLAQSKAEFLEGSKLFLSGAAPIATTIREWERSLGLNTGGGIPGLVNQGIITSHETDTFTRVPGPVGLGRLAMVHGAETVRSPSQEDRLLTAVSQVVELLSGGLNANVNNNVELKLSIDGRDVAFALQRVESRGRTPGVALARPVGRG